MFKELKVFLLTRRLEIYQWAQQLLEQLSMQPDKAQELIELEQLAERIRQSDNKFLQDDFRSIVAWTSLFLDRLVLPVDEETDDMGMVETVCLQADDFKVLHQTSSLIRSLMDQVALEEEKIREERTRIENQLRARRDGFQVEIEQLCRESESLEEFESVFMVKEANEQVDRLNDSLKALTAQMVDINLNEDLLGQNVSEYPLFAQLVSRLKPFE